MLTMQSAAWLKLDRDDFVIEYEDLLEEQDRWIEAQLIAENEREAADWKDYYAMRGIDYA